MPAPPLLRNNTDPARLVKACAAGCARAVTVLRALTALMAKTTQRAWTTAPHELATGWRKVRDSWTKQDWMAGIEPIPEDLAGNMAASAIVVALVLTSLLYGETHNRKVRDERLVPSGELALRPALPAETPPPAAPPGNVPRPVPEPVRPEAAPAPSASVPRVHVGEAFVDGFSSPELDPGWYISDGWTNGDYMENDWRASQVAVGAGGLELKLSKGPQGSRKPLSSGEIRTQAFYRYGYFEARLRIPRGSGLIAGMFTYAARAGAVKPNEIDIEFTGRDTRRVELTIHVDGQPQHKKLALPFDAAEGFHTYAFDWQPGYVRWYIDGVMVHEIAGGPAARLNRPQQLMFNLWSTRRLAAWAGEVDVRRAHAPMQVACAAYQPSYPGRPLCQESRP